MPVGKGSLNRAAKAKVNTETVSEKPKVSRSKVVSASVISGGTDNIHEKKFEAVSKIKCDLPTYLL